MSSILTNTGAMVALQTMRSINTSLNDIQGQISTGKKVATAKDNAAVWAISKVMESDVKGFRGIQESLSVGQSTITVGRTAAETVTNLLTEMKGKIVAAQEENVDRGKIQTDIVALRDQIESVVNAAQFNGLNLVKGTEQMSVLSSLDRSSDGTVSASQIRVARQDLTTDAGTLGTVDAAKASNITFDGNPTGTISSDPNTAQVTYGAAAAGAFENETFTVTVGDFEVSYTGTAADTNEDIAAAMAQRINALGLPGVAAEVVGANDNILQINSTLAFEGLEVEVSGSAVGTPEITQLNGDPATGPVGTINARATAIEFDVAAVVSEGDGYRLTFDIDGDEREFAFTAGPNMTMSDVAEGLKRAIDGAGLDGVTTQLRVDGASGAVTLLVDNDSATDIGVTRMGFVGGEASGGLFGLDLIDVTTEAGARSALTNIESMIQRAIDASSSFGSSQGRVEIQSEFVNQLTDSLRAGIGTLVDADMEEASARLQALQVQQQLAIQSLSIANQAPQNILSLFR